MAHGYAAMKWFGYFPGNEQRGLPDGRSTANEGVSGMPVAIMDGT